MNLKFTGKKRQVVLDTETTGFNKITDSNKFECISEGHYIIEVAAIELIDRIQHRRYHQYIKSPISSTDESFSIHGITVDFLKDKPTFNEIASDLFNFIDGSELIIHNAPFDIAFLNKEFSRTDRFKDIIITNHCNVIDTLTEARKLFPGKKNNLDALCKRFDISTSDRDLHGAMIDTDLLLKVYLKMTGGQKFIIFSNNLEDIDNTKLDKNSLNDFKNIKFPIAYANKEELDLHKELMTYIKNIN